MQDLNTLFFTPGAPVEQFIVTYNGNRTKSRDRQKGKSVYFIHFICPLPSSWAHHFLH